VKSMLYSVSQYSVEFLSHTGVSYDNNATAAVVEQVETLWRCVKKV